MKFKEHIIDNTNPPPSELEFTILENDLGAKLPPDYKDFLLACNGGSLDYEIQIEIKKGINENLCFGTLYKLDIHGEWETNPYELRNERRQKGFPREGVIPIARDAGSSILYLDLRKGYKVVAFIESLPSWAGLTQNDGLVEVGSSFSDYLGKLHISERTAEKHIKSFQLTNENIKATIEWLDTGRLDWRVKFKDLWNNRISGHKI